MENKRTQLWLELSFKAEGNMKTFIEHGLLQKGLSLLVHGVLTQLVSYQLPPGKAHYELIPLTHMKHGLIARKFNNNIKLGCQGLFFASHH